MGVLDNLLARIGYTKGAPTGAGLFAPRTASTGWGGSIPTYPMTFTGWPDRNPNQQTLTAYQALLTSWVYSDVQVLAREFQAPALNVLEMSGEDTIDVPNHALETLFSRPNPYMGKSFLLSFWLHSMLLKGKAAFYFAPMGSGGEIGEIWPLPPTQFRAIGDAKDFISGYEFKANADSKAIIIDPKYICYSRLVNPANLREGLAPLDAAMNAVMTDQSMATWARNFFETKKTVPDSIVVLPKDISEIDFQTIKTEILEGLFGNGKGIGFARSGDMDLKPFGFDMQKTQQIEARKFSRDEIDRVFGIPEGYWSAGASRANADHAGDAVLGNVVHPYHVMLAEDLTAQILPIFYGEQFVAEFEDVRPRNIALELQQVDRRVKYWTIDELRAEDGLDPIAEITEDPEDKRGNLLIAEVVAKQAPGLLGPVVPPASATTGNDVPPDMTDTAPDNPADEVEQLETRYPEAAPLKSEAYADLERWQTKALKAIKSGKSAVVKFESEHVPELLAIAIDSRLMRGDDVRNVFTAAPFMKREPSDALSQDEQALYDALEPTLTAWGGDVSALIRKDGKVDYDAIGNDLRDAIAPILQSRVLAQLSQRNTTYGIDSGGAGVNAATQWAKDYPFELVKGLTDTTREVVQRAVADYTATPGMTRGELEVRLQPAFGAQRAENIAVTETTRAASAATDSYQAALSEMGYKSVKVWQTLNDELTCDICGPLNGLDETQWGEVDDAPAHPRCRCSTVLKITKDE